MKNISGKIQIFIYISLILFVNCLDLKSDIIDDLRKNSNADKNDNLIIFYFEMASCVKCYIEPMEIIQNLELNSNLKGYKIIAVVVCDRDIELKIFKKEQDWKYTMFRNDGTVKTKLGAIPDSFITIINSNNQKIHFKQGNPKYTYNKIIEFIKD